MVHGQRLLTGGGMLLGLALSACTATAPTAGSTPEAQTGSADAPSPVVSTAAPTAATTPSPTTPFPTTPSPTASSPTTPIPTRTPKPEFDARDVLADVETLAEDIGPREATGKNFDRAADVVQKRFEKLEYEVDTESVTVPAGNSWGTP